MSGGYREALKDAQAVRGEIVAALEARLGSLDAAKLRLEARRETIEVEIAEAEALLGEQLSTLASIEAEIFKAGASGEEVDEKAFKRQKRMRRAADKTQELIDELKRYRGRIPNEIASLEASAASLRAALEPDAIDDRALAAVQDAARRRVEDGARLRKQIAKERKAWRDQDGPTPEAVVKRGASPSKIGGAVRLAADLPDPVRRLVSMKKVSRLEAEAGARYRDDYRFGLERARLTGSYEGAIARGRRSAGDVADDRIAAFDRYRAAKAAIPAEFVRVIEAVFLEELALDSVDLEGDLYAEGSSNRRSAIGVLLVFGLKRLKEFYQSEFGA